jgi:6-phosphogluconolactonase (cycloisomerase 2 family)
MSIDCALTRSPLRGLSILLALSLLLASCGGDVGGDAASNKIPRFTYVVNGGDNTVSAYTINATTGALTLVPGSPFATGSVPGAFPISISVAPSGRFAYVANDGSNDVWAYIINATTGALTAVPGGPFAPSTDTRFVTVDPSGKFAYVANCCSHTVSAYTISATTGALTPVGVPVQTGMSPISVAVDPSGKFAYVANNGSDDVSAYTINATTGALIPVPGSPFAAGDGPFYVDVDPSGKFAYVANQLSDNVSVYTISAATGALTPVGTAVPAGTNPNAITTTGTIQ